MSYCTTCGKKGTGSGVCSSCQAHHTFVNSHMAMMGDGADLDWQCDKICVCMCSLLFLAVMFAASILYLIGCTLLFVLTCGKVNGFDAVFKKKEQPQTAESGSVKNEVMTPNTSGDIERGEPKAQNKEEARLRSQQRNAAAAALEAKKSPPTSPPTSPPPPIHPNSGNTKNSVELSKALDTLRDTVRAEEAKQSKKKQTNTSKSTQGAGASAGNVTVTASKSPSEQSQRDALAQLQKRLDNFESTQRQQQTGDNQV